MNWSNRIRQFGNLPNALKIVTSVARNHMPILILVATTAWISLSILAYRTFDDRTDKQQAAVTYLPIDITSERTEVANIVPTALADIAVRVPPLPASTGRIEQNYSDKSAAPAVPADATPAESSRQQIAGSGQSVTETAGGWAHPHVRLDFDEHQDIEPELDAAAVGIAEIETGPDNESELAGGNPESEIALTGVFDPDDSKVVLREPAKHTDTGSDKRTEIWKSPEQRVAMVNLERTEQDKPTALGEHQRDKETTEIEFQLESSPIDAMSIVPEGLELDWTASVLGKNDTISRIFKRNGIDLSLMSRLLNMPGTGMLSTVFPKDEFRFAWGGDGKLVGVEFRRPKKGSLMFVINDDDIETVDPATARQAGSLQSLFDRERDLAVHEKQEEFANAVATISESPIKWHEITVRRGDTLGRIFNRVGVSGALEVANAPTGNWLRSGLMPKQDLRVATHPDGTFALIEVYDLRNEKVRMVVADGENLTAGFRKMQTEVSEFQACAIIKNNVYSAAKSAGIPNSAVDEYTQVFASRIDFSRQLKKGDRYCMIYEKKYFRQKQVGRVRIVAASLEQKDHHIQAFRLVDNSGDAGYYDQDGENMLGHFLRAPVKSARVTSVFTSKRFHPILKRYRKHQGVDYGAPRNTPIMSTADGIVSKRMNDPNGYGKVLFIRHGGKYLTVYAHMNAFASNTGVGSHVKQGQVIGYVGSSGMSTGDHVHYEFRVDGVHRDPLNYEMPKGEPVPAELRKDFDQMVEVLSARLGNSDNTKLVSAPQ